jgi:methionyl-tRNA synthetase
VPEPGELDEEDRALVAQVKAGFETVGALHNAVHLRAVLSEVLALAREANGYCDRTALWFHIKEDRQAAAMTVYVTRSVRVIDNLKTLISPVLPHSAQKIHEYFGHEGQLFGTQQVVTYEEATRSHEALTYDHTGAVGTWSPSTLPAGQALREPAPLFRKLDESVIEEEYARLEG